MTELTHETHLLGTAHDLGVLLGFEDPNVFARSVTGGPLFDRIALTNAQARRLLALASRDPLIAAYNAVFDFKDTQPAGSSKDYAAYEALQALEKVLELNGTPAPRRFDNKIFNDRTDPKNYFGHDPTRAPDTRPKRSKP